MFLKLFLFIALPFAVAQQCSDDPDFTWTYTFDNIEYTHHCSFLTASSRQTQNEKRQRNHCDRPVGYSNRLVREFCRRSCDNCQNDEECFSVPRNYRDINDRRCAFFGRNPDRCNTRERNIGTDGRTPQQACCECGGGSRPNRPPNQPACRDFRNWMDTRGNDCEFYSGGFGNNRCAASWQYQDDNGIGAREACCTCGGGNNRALDTLVAEE